MSHYLVSQAISISAPPSRLWEALVHPDAGDRWRIAHFRTDWRLGEAFEIATTIGTKLYRDKGRVIAIEPPSLLQYSYWSRVSGLPDIPSSYSTVTMALKPRGDETLLTVEQQVPASPVRKGDGWEIGEESGRHHVAFYWRMTLPILKRAVEAGWPFSEA
ncbi:SRPBCC domain-containing protein [Agrobacterium sp. SOY23]|uniref:SRPBCC family protein n=1 Tax=Agrobacterium sp. SOY23 TaxID=3014555 RepID=UPI0022B00DEA|nr:SRPBCC domain-containing protein [Agrobacterium sp. SOY23]MCZ4429684.1 SRPBCC domain-containing protein [Agrobacterium sp. SOY23]